MKIYNFNILEYWGEQDQKHEQAIYNFNILEYWSEQEQEHEQAMEYGNKDARCRHRGIGLMQN